MKKYFLIFLSVVLSFSSITVWAQPPYSACFTVNATRGCAPFTVNVTSCSQSGPLVGQPNPSYIYDLAGAPSVSTQSTSNLYSTPGTYVIRQTVNDGVGFTVFTDETIEVLGKPDPIYTASACAGLGVRVVITDTNYDSFQVDYGDGNVVTVLAGVYNYTYASASTFTVTVTGLYSIACTGAAKSSSITTFTSLTTPDVLDLTVTGQSTTAGTIDLRYSGIAARQYVLESKVNNGAYALLMNTTSGSTGIQTLSIGSLNTQANTYTFRIRNTDVCGNNSAYSSQIASILISTTVLNGANQINFSSNGGLVFSSLDLHRDNSLYQSSVTSPALDNTVKCGTDYCYQIQGTFPTISSTLGTNHKSYSYTGCVKANYSGIIPAVTNVNSTVEGNAVKVVWDTPVLNTASAPVGFYSVFRQDGSAYVNYGSTNTSNFTDNLADVNNFPYCYRITYKDPCNNAVTSTQSMNTCSVHLTVDRKEEENTLTWTAYGGYQSGIKEYRIENLDLEGNIVTSKSAGLTTTYTEIADQTLAQIIYRIKVVANSPENIESVSNQVKLDLTPQLFMPNVFSPNSDGDNDILMVKGKYFKSLKMTIFNKWGEVVFVSNDASIGWDGSYKGQPATIDAYAYKIVALDNKGGEVLLDGTVSLIR